MKRLAIGVVTIVLLVTGFVLYQTHGSSHGIARLAADNLSVATIYRQMKWEELIPKGWDSGAVFQGVKLSRLKDSDPKAIELLEKMRVLWDEAPVEQSLEGQHIRLPGFVIPLERTGDQVLEFLLVPYFGACIHSPPPPANQIIHVIMIKPISDMHMMDIIWVSGRMKILRADTSMGISGYQMEGALVEPYITPIPSTKP
jgi:uncharacterized protein